LAQLLTAAGLAAAVGACGPAAAPPPADPVKAAREAASASADSEVAGRWLLAELLAPGGDATRAGEAAKKVGAAKGLYASLGRAIEAESHGRFADAASAHLDALAAARTSPSQDAPLVGWFAANHLLRLRSSVQGLWAKAKDGVVQAIDAPGNIGWRARGELVEWWSLDALRGASTADLPGGSVLEALAKKYGCVERARIAGPFGHLSASDHRTSFDAERPGPWPVVFPRDPRRHEAPRVLESARRGCIVRATEPVGPGVFYVETFVDAPAEREVLIAVQGAFSVRVDDVEVLARDTREWGIWPRFGAHVRLSAGRHRILARVGSPETSVRVMTPAGTPANLETSTDGAPPYAVTPPEVLADPNPLDGYLVALGVPAQPGAPKLPPPAGLADATSRALAAYLAHVEGQDDVADVLIEPLVKDPARATGPALGQQAVFTEKDPIFAPGEARDLVKDVRARAASKDPNLWWPRLWLALDEADKSGLPEVAPKVVALADEFREVPDIRKGLAQMYGRIGWKPEQARAIKDAAARFPDDVEALGALLKLYDEQGYVAEADKVAARIHELDPESELDFERALERRDYKAAIKELERVAARRKDRKDIALRIADLLTRAGSSDETLDKLERALALKPTDAVARLALADARFARGDRAALHKALVDAIQTGSDASSLREAIELVEGLTELSPYRVDGKKVIAEFEAAGQKLPAAAARVLDYSAMWVHESGVARMLEHEIIFIQSREAIEEHAEQRVPRGLVLKLRTVKKDGRVLEPEIVEGKPTVTMPHLEVGDYIETENVTTIGSEGNGGRIFDGPRWFFREEKIAYWRSEFIVVSPKNRPLDIETGGSVPAPTVSESGALVTRRWRVDKSPALPEEPGSAPIQEFLPNVRVGWGITLAEVLSRMVDAASDETPRDPRLARIAETIARSGATDDDHAKDDGAKGAKKPAAEAPQGAMPASVDERARRIYRWVLANVENGREGDPRRVVLGKSGNRTEAFLYLCRLLGIDARLGVVRDRLTPPSRGPMSEAESYGVVAVRLASEKGPRWMLVRDKFAPYGYLPSSLRGQPAVVLVAGTPHETTPTTGPQDGVSYEGTAELAADGSARIDLEQRFEGKFAIAVRAALETLPDARLKDTIESRLLSQALPGAHLLSLDVKNLGDLDAPLTLAMKVEASSLARPRGSELVLSPPFLVNIGGLASLPARETPLYLSEQLATRTSVSLRVKLPDGARVATALEPASAADGPRTAKVGDRVDGATLVFERVVDVPAGRVQPDAYGVFQDFARRADQALRRDVVIALRGAP
jgi:tetratricopeptide (TPR) repeat protein